MKISLPDQTGRLRDYQMRGGPGISEPLTADPARIVFAAAHVVADPFTNNDPRETATVDWEATLKFRRHLAGLGLGIAESMDTAQRGMGLDWTGALELIRQTKADLPDALVINGAGTDHLAPGDAHGLDDVRRAYAEQIRPYLGDRHYRVLGTDGFGRSDTRERLRHFFEVDRKFIALAALRSLMDENVIDAGVVVAAMKDLGIDPEKPEPVAV